MRFALILVACFLGCAGTNAPHTHIYEMRGVVRGHRGQDPIYEMRCVKCGEVLYCEIK